MIRRRSLRTRAIKLLVLDEADEMLNKGTNGGSSQLLFSEVNNFLLVNLRPYGMMMIISQVLTFLTKCFDSFSGFKEQIYDVYRYLPPATQASYTRLCGNVLKTLTFYPGLRVTYLSKGGSQGVKQ